MADTAQNEHTDPSGDGPETESATPREDKTRFYDLVRHLIDDLALLFRKELALAGSEVSHSLNDAKKGVSGLISGVVVLNSGYLVLLAAATLGLGKIMELWLAALIVGGVVTVIGLIMVTAGKKKLEPSSMKPTRTMDSLQKDRETARGHVK
ncbi:MAG: phage holin family protein [Marinobacter sp.]|uniref:phage holin family protein n=1 Tax=Marinobacter sp. TaxID=50741 RepID=UPI0034A059F0